MTDTRKAKLAFLSQSEPGVFVLNLRFETDDPLLRVEISRAQLGNAVVDGAVMLWGSEIAINPEPPRVDIGGIGKRGLG